MVWVLFRHWGGKSGFNRKDLVAVCDTHESMLARMQEHIHIYKDTDVHGFFWAWTVYVDIVDKGTGWARQECAREDMEYYSMKGKRISFHEALETIA